MDDEPPARFQHPTHLIDEWQQLALGKMLDNVKCYNNIKGRVGW